LPKAFRFAGKLAKISEMFNPQMQFDGLRFGFRAKAAKAAKGRIPLFVFLRVLRATFQLPELYICARGQNRKS
jgi:hypothetical protein